MGTVKFQNMGMQKWSNKIPHKKNLFYESNTKIKSFTV